MSGLAFGKEELHNPCTSEPLFEVCPSAQRVEQIIVDVVGLEQFERMSVHRHR